MRVAVLGAGVVGVATAYELARDGHEVVVVDRHPEPASETSLTAAGLIAPAHAHAWASPLALRTMIQALWRDDLALRLRLRFDPRFWRWAFRFVGQCTNERARENTRHKIALSLYSQACLQKVVAETAVDHAARSVGAVYLHRTTKSFARGAAKALLMRQCGVEVYPIGTERLAKIDPIYESVKGQLAGAMFAAEDESGDAHAFTLQLAEVCRQIGVEFRMSEPITAIWADGDRVESVRTSVSEIRADAFVLALGCESARLGRQVGLDLPIWPVKGYSLTLPVTASSRPPVVPGIDEDNLLAFANFGDRVRLTAIAEFGGYDHTHRPGDFTPIIAKAKKLFPEAGDYTRPEYRVGLRPMTPTSLPILGTGRLKNLFVNSGHGDMGWTWACGTARITADLLQGLPPEHDPTPMLLQ